MPEIDYDRLRESLGSGDRQRRVSSVSSAARRARAGRSGGADPFGTISAEPAKKQGGGGGILDMIGGNLSQGVRDIVSAAPAGIAGLGADAWDNTVGNVGAMVARRIPGVDVDRVRDDFSVFGRAFINEDTMEALDEGKSTGDTLFAANPLLTEFGKSLSDTGGRVTQQAAALAPGGLAAGDTDYVQAFKEKRLLPLLVEDVGNAAIVGSTVAKPVAAAGRAAARKTGSPTVAKAAVKAGDIADMSRGIDETIGKAIFAPFTVPAKAAGRGVQAGAKRVAGTESYQGWRNSPVVERVMDRWGFGQRARPIHQQIADLRETGAFKQDIVLRAAKDVADIAGETPELGFAAMVSLSQVNRLLPDLTKLDEGTLNSLFDENGPLGSFFSDLYSIDQARGGFMLANQLLRDPDSVAPDVRAKIDGIADLWAERVLPVMEDHYLSQVGRWDEIHPETAQMLAGDDLLPYEEMRVLADHMETERRLIDARDRASENVGRKEKRLGVDEALLSDPIRVMRERAGDIERAIDGLIETRGVTGVMEMLRDTEARIDIDTFSTSPRPAQMEVLRSEVRRQIDARAAALSLGRELPVDGLTDLVADLGLGQVLRGRARTTRAASRETRAEGVRRQAETDAGRLDTRLDRLDVKAEDLAEILHDALTPKVDVPLGKLRASVRKEGAASKAMGNAAAALTRIKNKVQGEELKPGDLAKDVTAFRREARTVLVDMVTEARDRAIAGRADRIRDLTDQWATLTERQTIGLDTDGWATVQGALRQAGHFGDPRDVKLDGVRVFVDAAKSSKQRAAVDAVAEGASRYQNFGDGTVNTFLERLAAEVVAPAQVLQRNTVTKSKGVRRRGKRGQDEGDTSLYAEAPFDEVLLSDLTPAQMLDELLDDPDLLASVFDDPEMVATLAGDEATAVEALRAMRAERWEGEDFAEAVDTGELLRAIDEEAADLAAGDPRSILASDEIPGIGTTGRSAAREAYEGNLGKAAEAGYDLEAGRRDMERRAKVRANEEKRAVDAAAEKGARAAAGPARRLGKVEGEAQGVGREQRLAETRAGRDNDAETATAEAIAEAQGVAFERGRIEGARMEALSKARREMDKIDEALKTNSDGLLARLDDARNKIESAPARQRVALAIAARLDDYLADQIADEGLDSFTREQLAEIKADIITGAVAAQDVLDNPGLMKGGKPRGAKARGSAAMAPKSTSEFLKEGTSTPLSPPDQALLHVREIERGTRTQAAKWMVDEYGTTIADKIPDSDRMSPEALHDAIEQAGMVAVNPQSMLSPKDGNVPLAQYGPDTILLPHWAMEAWRGSNAPAGVLERALQDWWDRPTRVLFKTPVLALSQTWHAGTVAGNVLLAWAAGVPPARQVELYRDGLAMLNRARRGEFLPGDAPPRMWGTGMSAEMAQMEQVLGESASGMPTRSELAMVGAVPKGNFFGAAHRAGQKAQRAVAGNPLAERTTLPSRARGGMRRTVAHPIRMSYAFGSFVDDLGHSIIYLDQTSKGVDPQTAMREALHVAGDFSRMTNVERRFARRVLPFYSWLRHITQLSVRLPIEHPLRTAWTMHLWTMAVPEDQDLYTDVPMVAGSLPLGDNQFARLTSLFPFGSAMDLAEGGMTDPLAMIGAASNPIPRLALEGMTGLTFGPGGLKPLSRPFGTGSTDAFGNDRLAPIGWGPFLQRATNVLPQTRGIRELLRDKEDRVVRYGTGHPVTIDGATIPEVNRRDTGEIISRDLLRLPILPPAEYDVEAIRARRDEKKRRRER